MISRPTHPEVDTACRSAAATFAEFSNLSGLQRAEILETIASALDVHRDQILSICSDETALTIDELTPEFARMTGTLRMFANLIRDGSWVRAAIDTRADAAIGPGHDVRSMLVPLGPVAVFGSSNFPLAYGVCGGDTASALAAGCPVIVKEHPAHPRTGRLLTSIAQGAIARPLLLQYIHNQDPADFSIAGSLVQHPAIAAVGFTGSIPGGLAIERLARERNTPIPVFAEMGSTNPIFITPGALRARPVEIGRQIAASVLARVGQQCTRPGLIFVPHCDDERASVEALGNVIKASHDRAMLAPWIARKFIDRVNEVEDRGLASAIAWPGSDADSKLPQPSILVAQLTDFIAHRALREEIFGPAAIVVELEAWDDFARVPLAGNLTLSIFFDETDAQDTARARAVAERHGSSAGRIIFNGVPTGVRVATGVVHGGPFPATNVPHTTAVGPRAIERWCRPVCYQNAPEPLLPPALRLANPLAIWRTLNGQITSPSRPE